MKRVGGWSTASRPVAAVAVAVVLTAGGVIGCGGSEGASTDAEAIEMRIDRERAEAAALERQEQRVKRLRAEVKRLEQRAPEASAPPAATQTGSTGTSSIRVFHAPSGNVSCEISESSARCSVAAAGQTFVFDPGGEGRIESGLALSRGSGSPVDWGSTVTLGDVRCSIPRENEPRGVTCEDVSSGHGFEASRVSGRQRAY